MVGQFFRAVIIARDLLATLYEVSNSICVMARKALPLAKRQYPNNAVLHEALQGVTNVCEALALAIQDQKVADREGANHEVPATPAQPTPVPETPEPDPEEPEEPDE